LNIRHKHNEKDKNVWISEHLLNQMYLLSMRHYPNEFGGILVGVQNDNDVIISDFEVPNKFDNNKNQFTRHASKLNKYLHESYSKSNGKLEYLGEWHTHPNTNPNFSRNDEESMKELAEDPKVKTNHPALIILGVSKKNYDYKLYICFEGKLKHLNQITKI